MSTVKDRKRYLLYDTEEPPEKRIISDGDLLIKQLVHTQQNTKVDLREQLLNPKEFEKSTELVPLTKNHSGTCTLRKFEEITAQSGNVEKFKAAGLCNEDIQLILDYHNGTLYEKHKNFEQSLLETKINQLIAILEDFDREHNVSDNSSVEEIQDRHKTEFGLSVKPESIQTKLLKFAVQNERKNKLGFHHPMDNIKEIERDLFQHLSEKVESPLKIQKKLRKLASKVGRIGETSNISCDEQNVRNGCRKSDSVSYLRNSKWDKQEVEIEPLKHVEVKIFTCKPQNYYTIRDGCIVKLTGNEIENKNLEILKYKLSVDEIRQIPKFANYDPGPPSKVLYARNLPGSVKEIDLKLLFSNYNSDSSLVLRIMTGRMKGQAFITFPNEIEASSALDEINGTVIGDKPIVLEFGRQNK